MDHLKKDLISNDLNIEVTRNYGLTASHKVSELLWHLSIAIIVVTIFVMLAMAPVDYSIASHVHQHLLQKGVQLYLEQGIEYFERYGNRLKVFFGSGAVIDADIVILSIGVRPETALAKASGIAVGETGGIKVNEYLETSANNIYAVGDAIEYPHPLTGKPWLNYLANPANRQGRIVADNMVSGNISQYEGAIGTSIAKVFDLTVASTGLAAKRLKQWGISYQSSTTHSASHAGYYPDALPLTLKLTFDPVNGKLYGAQCVGYDGVDKRIDQIAQLIKNNGTVYDLIKTEHEELESLVKNFPTIKRARFWMTFGQEYLTHLRVIQNIGMARIDEVDYNGTKIIPLQFLKAVLPNPQDLGENYEGETSIGCRISGSKDGKQRTYYVYNNCSHQEAYKETGMQGVSYTTGVPAMIGAMMFMD